jgi:threonine dehydrogenase-like Zn-dependent dehydrogenase
MRAAIFRGGVNPIAIEDVPEPRPQLDEVIVAVSRCGICGSDVSMTSGSPFDYPNGNRLGHEYAGEVVEVGRGVTGLEVGDRVACMPGGSCGDCEACKRGQFSFFCPSVRPFSGGFGEYVAVGERSAIRLPDSLSMSDGALVEPMAVGLHSLNMAGLGGGEHILVLGAGSMALGIIYWGRRLGARRITVASRSAHRREIAEAMGADAFHRLGHDDPGEIGHIFGQPDIVAECVGKPGMVDKAVQAVRPGGTVISLGMCPQAEPILAAACTFKEIRMLFPLGYSVAEFEHTARAFESGHVRPDAMVSDVIGLDALPAEIEALRAGAKTLKVLVDPTPRGA